MTPDPPSISYQELIWSKTDLMITFLETCYNLICTERERDVHTMRIYLLQ